LKVGDTVKVWWRPGRDTITSIVPYNGRLKCMRGGWIFRFAIWTIGMTVHPDDRFEVGGIL